MTNPKPFGRRGAAAPRPVRAMRVAAPVSAPVHMEDDDAPPPPVRRSRAPIDPELAEWKASRKRPPIPWRQLSLMASLCFGIASFKLPDDLNDLLQWPLYALAAMSFYVWWSGRKAKRNSDAPTPEPDASEAVTAP